MGGLARRMPQTAIVFLVGTLSLAGIPLFGGFLSKEEILGAVWAGGLVGPFVLLMLVAFLTAFYMFRVVFLAFFGAAAAGTARHHAVDAGHSHDVGDVARSPSRPARSADQRWRCRCGSWRCCRSAIGVVLHVRRHAAQPRSSIERPAG